MRDVGGGNFRLYHAQADAQADANAIQFTSQGTGSSQTIKAAQGIEGSNAGSSAVASATGAGDRSSFQSAGQVGTPQLSGMDLTGNGNQSQVNDPAFQGARTTSVDQQSGFHGVAVAATNQDEIKTFVITLGAGVVGVAVSAGVDVVNADTEAFVASNAQVNADTAGASANQSVLVGAGDDFYHLSLGVGVGVGAVGVAPSVGVNVIGNTTLATIGTGATVNALNNIAVEATAQEDIVMIGIGVAAGSVGVGAVVDVLVVGNTTTASIGDSAHVHAGGDVFVSAEDDTHVLELSGALAGGVVGVGGAVGVMVIGKDTEATIGADAHVDGLGNGGGVGGTLDGNINGNSFETTTAHGATARRSRARTSRTSSRPVAWICCVSGAVGVAVINVTTDATINAGAEIDLADTQAGGSFNPGDVSVAGYALFLGTGTGLNTGDQTTYTGPNQGCSTL